MRTSAWIDNGVVLLVLLTAGLTFAFFVFLVWRRGYVKGWRASRGAPRCPTCGYNLSGLTYCRCPECGTEYTLDELWRSVNYVQEK